MIPADKARSRSDRETTADSTGRIPADSVMEEAKAGRIGSVNREPIPAGTTGKESLADSTNTIPADRIPKMYEIIRTDSATAADSRNRIKDRIPRAAGETHASQTRGALQG